MTNLPKLSLSDPPVAIVLAQFTLLSPIAPLDPRLRELFKQIGLLRMKSKHERRFSLRPDSHVPEVREKVVTIFLDQRQERGVSLDGNNLIYFTGMHTNFSEFAEALSEIVACTTPGGIDFKFQSMALRYVNVFEILEDNLDVMSSSLRGMNWKNLGNRHHHHKYQFWCETDRGRLDLRFATEHGDKLPENLGHAADVFSPMHLRSSDEIVAHLDIFETTKPVTDSSACSRWKNCLKEMNRTIEAAFIDAIDPVALVQRFGKKESQ